MAGLLLELLQKINKEYRPYFEVHPGISSVQLAAAISGAPLMNDFCSVSLSDKLLDSKKLFKEFAINSFLVFLSQPIPIHKTGGCQVFS